jgi:TnsA-like endonuclease N terminal
MFLEKIDGILPGQRVSVKYDCNGGFKRCGTETTLKLKDALKNHDNNDGKLICHQCQLTSKNPMTRKEVVDKIKQTNTKRYGNSCSMNRPDLIEERRKKWEDAEYVADIIEKRRQTSLDKYGVDHHMKSQEVQEKQKQVMQEKYGVDHPLQNKEIVKKMKQTNLERYGVENVAAVPEVRQKMAKTTLERYGVEHYNELPEMREYLRQHCREWLKESWESGGPNKGTTRLEEWNNKQRETVLTAIASGTWKGGGKNSLRGRFNSKKCIKSRPWFRSSYELITHLWLESQDIVIKYDYEPFAINYVGTDNHLRLYFPDFLVWFSNQELPLLIEVKNDYMLEAGINLSKNASAIEHAKKTGMLFEVWANTKMQLLGINIKDYKDDPRIEILRGEIK